jgi:hypothetical protein
MYGIGISYELPECAVRGETHEGAGLDQAPGFLQEADQRSREQGAGISHKRKPESSGVMAGARSVGCLASQGMLVAGLKGASTAAAAVGAAGEMGMLAGLLPAAWHAQAKAAAALEVRRTSVVGECAVVAC